MLVEGPAIHESTEQTNSIMLKLILRKYSREYRRYIKEKQKEDD